MADALGIRAAELSDAAAIGSLGIQLVHWADPDRARERMEAVLGRDDQAIFVAEDSKGLVGWIHVLTALRLTVDRFGEVVGLVVAQERREEGIGERLVEAAVGWARDNGLRSVRARSRTTRIPAHLFYEKIGFKKTKDQGVFDRAIAPRSC